MEDYYKRCTHTCAAGVKSLRTNQIRLNVVSSPKEQVLNHEFRYELSLVVKVCVGYEPSKTHENKTLNQFPCSRKLK